ncbi:isochorismatase domain-containing protein 1 [Arapaima gigas]
MAELHSTTTTAAAPPASNTVNSSGGAGQVPVLFSYSVFSRPSSVPLGSGYELLIQKFLSIYGHQIDVHRKFVIQVFSDEWGQYVDLPKGFVVAERCRLRLVPLQMDIATLGNLSPATTVFFCCDMQERFRPAIKYFGDIISVGQRLLQGARILGIPVIVSEQYPKGLGSTVQEMDLAGAKLVFPKTKFSMVLPEVEAALVEMPGLRSVVLFGVETHVCIQQTALDLIGRGFEVHIVADATSSRSMMDRMFALERLARTGIVITTSESILLQLVSDKDHPKFKEIQNIIKASAPESGLLSKWIAGSDVNVGRDIGFGSKPGRAQGLVAQRRKDGIRENGIYPGAVTGAGAPSTPGFCAPQTAAASRRQLGRNVDQLHRAPRSRVTTVEHPGGGGTRWHSDP